MSDAETLKSNAGSSSEGAAAPAAGSRPKGRWRRLAGKLALVLVLALAGLAAWVLAVPFPEEALQPDALTSTVITDRKGQPLREVLNGLEGRSRWLPLHEISHNLQLATIHVEDQRFYDHFGVDPLAIARSIALNIERGELFTGASTITQQTTKITLHRDRERTVERKLMELVWAIRLERGHSKQEILEQYLNRVPYGNQLFGAEAAARMYFGKPASGLTLAEAALLAGLPQAPSLYNPYRGLDAAQQRQRFILRLMRERGAVTEEDYQRALKEPITLRPRRGPLHAPHFTEHINDDLKAVSGPLPPSVPTTLDLQLQEQIEGIVEAHLSRIERHNAHQAAVVVLDTRRGEVLAWVGSRSWEDEAHGGANDGVVARRQPGSTLKPFVYGLYLERGGTAADMFADLPTQFPTADGVYIPRNFNQRHHGPVSLRHALGSSLNVPAVIAAAEIGPEAVLERLRLTGLETLDQAPDHYGLGIALGDGDVRLLDLTNAYAALGRQGRIKPVRTRLDQPEGSAAERRLFDEQVTFTLLDVLSDDDARSVGYGTQGPLDMPFRVAAKTGTSTNFKDSWAVGVTPLHTVGVWVGNFDGQPMNHIAGTRGAAPILRQIFQTLYPDASNPGDVPWFSTPRGMTRRSVCTLSGQPATPSCPHVRPELLPPDRAGASAPPGVGGTRGPGPAACELHLTLRIDTRNGLRAGEGCPEATTTTTPFTRVPPAWREWAAQAGLQPPPDAFSPLCPPSADELRQLDPTPATRLSIVHPLQGDVFTLDPALPHDQQRLTLRAHADAPGPLTWFIDGRPLNTVSTPFTSSWLMAAGAHTIGLGSSPDQAEVEVRIEVR